MNEEEGVEQTTDPPVSIEERVDGLELGMSKANLDQRRVALVVVQKLLEAVQGVLHVRDGRRDESRLRRGLLPAGPIQF